MSNNQPIIGILCIDIAIQLSMFGDEYKSYIAASYVKFLEGSGARIVPIWIGRDTYYYEIIMKQINGILIPGGAVFFDKNHHEPNKCVESSRIIFKIASEMNAAGNYFPVWGTCLGFELLLYHSASGIELRQCCESMNDSTFLIFDSNYKNSRMFKDLPESLDTAMRLEPVVYHFHRYCITRQDLKDFKIANQWNVTSTNKDKNGLEFISTIEHKIYPIYGVQFHPEKQPYEFNSLDNISHTENAIKTSQYFGNFFVGECRKNHNRFSSINDELRHLIFNFPIKFTSLKGSRWLQCYMFEDDISYPNNNCDSTKN